MGQKERKKKREKEKKDSGDKKQVINTEAILPDNKKKPSLQDSVTKKDD